MTLFNIPNSSLIFNKSSYISYSTNMQETNTKMFPHDFQNSTFATIFPVFTAIFIGLLFIVYRRTKNNKKIVDEAIMNSRISAYNPEPLIPEGVANCINPKEYQILNEDYSCLNLAKVNYMNFLNNEKLIKRAEECIRFYGVGTCGPRGFYGTIDVHLELENRLAKFMDMEEAVLYSYGFSTISSAIGAYCKKSDIIFCDKEISFRSVQGMVAAKSKIEYFKHNDMEDLETKLKVYEKKEQERNKLFRKFLIVEGIYEKSGTICPLPQLMELREKYKLRIFIDESNSFGILGKTGRGITEHYNVDRSNVDMIMATLEGAVNSIGGFCVGDSVVIEHQRLSGLGYCFSASLPTYLSQVAIDVLDIFEKNPKLFLELQNISINVHNELLKLEDYEVISHSLSPVKVITTKKQGNRNENINKINKSCVNEKVYLISSDENLVFHVNVALENSHIEKLIGALKSAATKL